MLAENLCMAPGYAALYWGRWAWLCTTSCVTPSVDQLVCLRLRHILSFDALIVDTGPAGSSCAALLSSYGVEDLLINR